MSSETVEKHLRPQRSAWGLLSLIFMAFIALGMPDNLIGVGWPSMRVDFGIPLDALGSLLLTQMAGYILSSAFSGPLSNRWGVGKILIASCLGAGLALLGYSLLPAWGMLVALGFVVGAGAGGIDSSLNAYMASHFDSGLMQWLHASFGIGATSGPLIMTWFLTHGSSWRNGYLLVAVFYLVLTALFIWKLPLWKRVPEGDQEETKAIQEHKPGLWETLMQGPVWTGIFLFLFYMSAEIIVGTWTYSLLTESRGLEPELAGVFTSSYWASFTLGRVVAGLLTRRVAIRRLIVACMGIALLGALLLLWNPWPLSSLLAVALLGISFAPIFPGLVTMTRARTGSLHAQNAIGLQQAAGVFGATVLNAGCGVLARRVGLETIPIGLVLIVTVVIILFLISHRKAPRLDQEKVSEIKNC